MVDAGYFCVAYCLRIYILMIFVQINICYVLGSVTSPLHALVHLVHKTNL